MDISSASSVSALSGQSVGMSVGSEVLKKTQQIQAQTIADLINAAPQPEKSAAANMPPHLGQNVNTTA